MMIDLKIFIRNFNWENYKYYIGNLRFFLIYENNILIYEKKKMGKLNIIMIM